MEEILHLELLPVFVGPLVVWWDVWKSSVQPPLPARYPAYHEVSIFAFLSMEMQ